MTDYRARYRDKMEDGAARVRDVKRRILSFCPWAAPYTKEGYLATSGEFISYEESRNPTPHEEDLIVETVMGKLGIEVTGTDLPRGDEAWILSSKVGAAVAREYRTWFVVMLGGWTGVIESGEVLRHKHHSPLRGEKPYYFIPRAEMEPFDTLLARITALKPETKTWFP